MTPIEQAAQQIADYAFANPTDADREYIAGIIKAQASAPVTDERAAFEEWLNGRYADEIDWFDVWQARAALAQPAAPRCQYCDGTGDVHSQTGEWLGSCDCARKAGAVEWCGLSTGKER